MPASSATTRYAADGPACPGISGRRFGREVKRLEKMEGNLSAVRVDTLEAITVLLEKEVVEFIDSDNGGAGVRLNPKPRGRRR